MNLFTSNLQPDPHLTKTHSHPSHQHSPDLPLLLFTDIDVFYNVARRTILSPFFVMWIPIIAIGQRSEPLYQASLWLLFLVSVFWFLNFTSFAWTNQCWWPRPERIDWPDQIVLITGGANGLGRVLAETLAVKQATVVVLDIDKPCTPSDFGKHAVNYRSTSLVLTIAPTDGDLHFYQCDVSDAAAVEAVAQLVQREVGHPTILVNNAGVVFGELITDLTADQIHRSVGFLSNLDSRLQTKSYQKG